MMTRTKRFKPRKKLEISNEEFFTYVLLMMGPPSAAYFSFSVGSHGMIFTGIGAWTKHTHQGQRFTQCVTDCGEAKSRAGHWYCLFTLWWLNKQGGEDTWKQHMPGLSAQIIRLIKKVSGWKLVRTGQNL